MHTKNLRVPHQKIANRLLRARPEMGNRFNSHIIALSDAEAQKVVSYFADYSVEDNSLFDAMSNRLVPSESGTKIYIRTLAAVVPVMNAFCVGRENALSYLTSMCLNMEKKSQKHDFDSGRLELMARGIMVGFLSGNVSNEGVDHMCWLGAHVEELAVHRETLKQHRSVSPRMCQLVLSGELLEIATPMVEGAL